MAFAVTGFATVAQNFISKGIASNFYSKLPLLAVLGALTIGNNKKTALQIGRPDAGEILSGKNISIGEKRSLEGINDYIARIQAFKTNNTVARTLRDNMPTVANPTTQSHGQAGQAGAIFRWVHVDTPLLIWHEDKIRAGQKGTKEGQGIAMSQLIDEATEVGMQDHLDWFADKVWNGVPTDQTQPLWDQPPGILEAMGTTNVYGLVDRNDAGNAVWKSQRDTALKSVDIARILDDVNLTKNLRVKGQGASLMLTTTALYAQFKTQILAAGGVILQNGMPEFASMGVKKEVLQKDNCYIMYDPGCPANNVAAFDLTSWKFMVHPQFNFKVEPFTDISKLSEGAKKADTSSISTRFMLTCDNPYLNCLYTAIGT
jgi:hypothetical protein